MTALFKDGIEVTGSMLVGADGPQLSVRSHLIEVDNAKPTPIDLATMICATHSWRDRALFLRSAPNQRFLQITSHPNGYHGSWDLTVLVFIIRNLGPSRTISHFWSLERSRIR